MRTIRKWMQRITKAAAVCCAALFAVIGSAAQSTADSYYLPMGEDLRFTSAAFSVEAMEKDRDVFAYGMPGNQSTAQLKILNVIPVKTISITHTQPQSVTLCGTPFGIRMFTNGVMVVKLAEISTKDGWKNPAEAAGIQTGDIVVSVNGNPVNQNEEIAEYCRKSQGNPLSLTIIRDGSTISCTLYPAYSQSEQCYKAGMWVRDSTAGIGTLTFYDTSTGRFGGLGHGVCDFDTAELMPLRSGDILPVTISGVSKGKRGDPGELRGYFSQDEAIGQMYANTESGVYGTMSQPPEGQVVEVAYKQDVCPGEVKIYTTVDNGDPVYYDACIEAVNYHGDGEGKNFVIRVTDERLLEKTGGIVQGMSGSPVLQNGKLVGAVTHVFVNDPTRGYGIFAENMLEIAQETEEIHHFSKVA